MRRAAAGVTVVAAVAALSGCSGGGSKPVATPDAPPAKLLAPDDCPSAGAAAAEWPQAVPASLPKPPGSQILSTHVVGPATYVDFTTPTSLRASTLYVVQALRAAGYTIARGDAEATEADAPFVGPDVVGAIRLTLNENCLTNWVLAVEPRVSTSLSVTPTLIPYHPGASASPLPFG